MRAALTGVLGLSLLFSAANVAIVGLAQESAPEDAPQATAAPETVAPPPVYDTRNGPKTADELQAELTYAGYSGPWDVPNMVAAYERAGKPTTAPPATVPFQPSADRQWLCSRYNPYNPSLATLTALSATNQPTWGPGGDFLMAYTWPAVYWSVATPGGMEPERIRDSLLDWLRGNRPSIDDKTRVDYLVNAETRARNAGSQSPATDWWMDYCPSARFDSDEALLRFVMDADAVPQFASAVMLAEVSNLHPSLRGGRPTSNVFAKDG